MGPFHIPWSTFGAVLMLGCAILLALVWAGLDKLGERGKRGRRGGTTDAGGGGGR